MITRYRRAKAEAEVPKQPTTTGQQALGQLLFREKYNLVPKPEVGNMDDDNTETDMSAYNRCQSKD